MKNIYIIISLAVLLFIGINGYGQIEVTADKISNLEVTSGPFIPIYGKINYDSYGHNFLHNGSNILSIGNLGIDMESNMRITREQPSGLKVDLLPYAMGTMTHPAGGSAIVTNDTENFSVNADDLGVVIITFNDASVKTSELIVQITPIATDLTSATQSNIETTNNNTMRVFLYTKNGATIADYGANILVFKP